MVAARAFAIAIAFCLALCFVGNGVAMAFDIRYHLKHVDDAFRKLGLLNDSEEGKIPWRG